MDKCEKEELLHLLQNNLPLLARNRFHSPDERLEKFLQKQNILSHVKYDVERCYEKLTQENLYAFLIERDESICNNCGSNLDFLNFKDGYKKDCLNCIELLNTKEEIYAHIKSNAYKYAQLLKSKHIKKHPIYKKINYDFKDMEDLYRYLNNLSTDDITCKLKSCNKKKRFRSFTFGYLDFCSLECFNKWLSISRKGNKNPIHNITYENRIK